MSDFKDKIQARIPKIAAQEKKRVQAETKALLEKIAKEREEQRLIERARNIGREVVELLREYDVPSVPIWRSRDSPIHEQVGAGWHVDSFYDRSSESGEVVHRAIDTDGQISRFHYTSHSGVDGIAEPYGISPEDLVSTLESDHFQDGIASLIHLKKPYGPN